MAALTSEDAYRATVLSGRATSQRARILAFVRSQKRPVSRAEIAEALGLPLASVCGRVFVLVHDGQLRELKDAGRGPMGDPVNLVTAPEGEGNGSSL